MFLTYQASNVNNCERNDKFHYMFSHSMGGFRSNEISSRDEILLVSSRDETHV